MSLTVIVAGRPSFNKATIMAWVYREGRFAFRMCRNITERRAQLSNWLRKAWAAVKREAAMLIAAARREADTRAHLAQRAREVAALAASFGNDAAAIQQAIASEHYRERMNFARVDALHAALHHIGA